MNRIRIRSTPAPRASLPGTGQPAATQREPHRPHLARWPGSGDPAEWFIRDVAADATVAGAAQNWPAPATTLKPNSPEKRQTATISESPITGGTCGLSGGRSPVVVTELSGRPQDGGYPPARWLATQAPPPWHAAIASQIGAPGEGRTRS